MPPSLAVSWKMDTRQQPMPAPAALSTETLALCNTGTNFHHLPAELRNAIYQMTLRHWRSIHIGAHDFTHHPHLEVSCGWDSDSLDKSKIRNHITVALLRTHKQIHREATPILYGSNSFFMCATPRFRSWAQQIGASFGLLRTLEIPIDVPAGRLPLRPHSVKAVHLKHLTLSISVFNCMSVERVAGYLACFLGGDSLHIEIVEDSYSNYTRSRSRGSTLMYPFGEDGEFESYGGRVKAELGRIMRNGIEKEGQSDDELH